MATGFESSNLPTPVERLKRLPAIAEPSELAIHSVGATELADFAVWRKAERRRVWRRRGLRVSILVIPTLIAGALWLQHRAARGHLPSVAAIERELHVWALPERLGILRGRPLRQVPFTRDASMLWRETPLYSLYLDQHGTPVAFCCAVPINRGDDLDSTSATRLRFADEFIGRYVGAVDYSAFNTSRLLDERVDSNMVRTINGDTIECNGFDVEFSVARNFQVSGTPEDANAMTYVMIVRARDW